MKAPPRPHNGTVRIEAVPRRSQKADTLSSDRCWEVRVLSTLDQVLAIRPTWEALQAEYADVSGLAKLGAIDFRRPGDSRTEEVGPVAKELGQTLNVNPFPTL